MPKWNEAQRLKRAEFLVNWFLAVFDGRKAPYPRRCFGGIAYHMRTLLASGGQYAEKYAEAGGRGPGAASSVRRRRR